jgi:hypothetical protein
MTADRPLLLPRLSREIQKFREQSPNGYLSIKVIERLRAIGYAEAREKDIPGPMLGAYLGEPGCGFVGEYHPTYGTLRYRQELALRKRGCSEEEIREELAHSDACCGWSEGRIYISPAYEDDVELQECMRDWKKVLAKR